MKKNYLFSLLLGSALLCSCNNNDDVLGGDSNQNEGVKDAYLSLKVNLPQAHFSRAAKPAPGEAGDGEDQGLPTENVIDNLLVYGFKSDGGVCKVKATLGSAELEKNTSVSSIWSAKEPIPVAAGTYHFYVIANPSDEMKAFQKETLTEEDLKKKVFQHSEFAYGKTTYFPMSTADIISDTQITTANTKTSPALLSVNLQRMFGKVVFEGFVESDHLVDFSNRTNFAEKFEFKKYGIVNQRKEAYIFRRVGLSKGDGVIGEKEIPNVNYVIDPAFDLKKYPFDKNIAIDHYWNQEQESAEANYWREVSLTKPNLEYVFENTMEKEAQLQGYTTGLVLNAQFTPKTVENGKTVTLGNTFYEYQKKYYASLDDLKAVCTQATTLIDVDTESNESSRNELIKLYQKIGVTVYYKSNCYYHYWIRHANNDDPNEMGIMEFGIVRNNVYKMKVNSINRPGSPVPPVTPDRPDEDNETFLNITVKVLPWVVRENIMDL